MPWRTEPAPRGGDDDLAIVLTGGGARTAYQVGVLRALARRYPDLRFPIICGVSGGAINSAFLAASRDGLASAADELAAICCGLRPEDVFRVGAGPLAGSVAHWSARLFSGGAPIREVRGLVDTRPLRSLLQRMLPSVDGAIVGVAENVAARRLRALAIATHSYTSGQSVTWVQGDDIAAWTRPTRVAVRTHIGVDHIMASTALPLLFPATRIGDGWYGDGGVGAATPLAPAIHLGANRILAISTHHVPTGVPPRRPRMDGYPPPAQVIGALIEALFFDTIDHDALRLERINAFLRKLPEGEREGLRPIDLLVVHPSRDLSEMARGHESRLPRAMRYLVRGLGSHEAASPGFLSVLLFVREYIEELLALGEADAERQMDRLAKLVEPRREQATNAAGPSIATAS